MIRWQELRRRLQKTINALALLPVCFVWMIVTFSGSLQAQQALPQARLDALGLDTLLEGLIESQRGAADRVQLVLHYDHLLERPALVSATAGWTRYPLPLRSARASGSAMSWSSSARSRRGIRSIVVAPCQRGRSRTRSFPNLYPGWIGRIGHPPSRSAPSGGRDALRRPLAGYPGARIYVKEFVNGPPISAPVAVRVVGRDL